MIGWLKELPDSMTGIMMGTAIWVGACYTLAPRAMERELGQSSSQSCTMMAKSQAQKLVAKRQSKEAEVGAAESALWQLKQVRNMLGDFGAYLDPQIGAAEAQVAASRLAVEASAGVKDAMSDQALRRTCMCAASKAVAGKRMQHAISLATFRIVSSDNLADVENEILQVLGTGVCSNPMS